MALIILCYVLGIAMLYLGFAQDISNGYTFGLIMILCALMWHYKEYMAKRNNKK